MDKKTWMTPREASKTLGVSIGTIYYWIKVKKHLRTKLMGSRYYVSRAQVLTLRRDGFQPKPEAVAEKAGAASA